MRARGFSDAFITAHMATSACMVQIIPAEAAAETGVPVTSMVSSMQQETSSTTADKYWSIAAGGICKCITHADACV